MWQTYYMHVIWTWIQQYWLITTFVMIVGSGIRTDSWSEHCSCISKHMQTRYHKWIKSNFVLSQFGCTTIMNVSDEQTTLSSCQLKEVKWNMHSTILYSKNIGSKKTLANYSSSSNFSPIYPISITFSMQVDFNLPKFFLPNFIKLVFIS